MILCKYCGKPLKRLSGVLLEDLGGYMQLKVCFHCGKAFRDTLYVGKLAKIKRRLSNGK